MQRNIDCVANMHGIMCRDWRRRHLCRRRYTFITSCCTLSVMKSKKKIVVIGGGTGIYPTLQGLKNDPNIQVSAIITMADSGGSSGRLRDEFGQLPVGDVRMALSALSADDSEHESVLRELFQYRFARGNGLKGHSVGNLILTALTDICGSEEKAVLAASKILRVRGTVIPVTNDNVHLVAKYNDGKIVENEDKIDVPPKEMFKHSIERLYTSSPAHITKSAKRAISEADMIVLGPGDLYTSILANIVVEGVPESIQTSKAKLVYVANIMTSRGQTYGMGVQAHTNEIEKYVGRKPDVVVVNTGTIRDDLLEKYKEWEQYPVENDIDTSRYAVIEENLIDDTPVVQKDGDIVDRSFIRGNKEKIATILISLLNDL